MKVGGTVSLEGGMIEWFRQDVMAFLPTFINCARLYQMLIPDVFGVLPPKLFSFSEKKK